MLCALSLSFCDQGAFWHEGLCIMADNSLNTASSWTEELIPGLEVMNWIVPGNSLASLTKEYHLSGGLT